ncbi:MAG: hypothetical protein M3N59_00280 [bacterium]|nr:hypothetical protein [bacterium]
MKRALLALTILLLGGILAVPSAYAATGQAGDAITVRENQIIRDDLYSAGETVTVSGTVEGDVVAAGGEVLITGRVTGSVWAAGATVRITGDVGGSLRTAASEVTVGGRVGGDVVAFAGTVELAGTAVIGRDLATAASEVTAEGNIGRNVWFSAERATIAGRVGGNVRGTAGSLFRLEPSARVAGNIRYSGTEELDRANGAVVGGTIDFTRQTEQREDSFVDRLNGQVYWFLASILLLLGILLYARRGALRAGELIGQRPGLSLLAGLGFLLIVPLVAGILLISVVGIPLSLFTLFGYALVLYTAKVFVALAVGRLAVRKAPDAFWPTLGVGILGLALYYVLAVIPIVGAVMTIMTLLVGTGAQVLLFRELYQANRKKYGA